MSRLSRVVDDLERRFDNESIAVIAAAYRDALLLALAKLEQLGKENEIQRRHLHMHETMRLMKIPPEAWRWNTTDIADKAIRAIDAYLVEERGR